MTNILDRISAQCRELSKSERLVADAVLADPELASTERIAELAARAGVSQPTVHRFAKRFGIPGFPQLKVALAASIASESRRPSDQLHDGDTVEDVATKVINSTLSDLNRLSRSIEPAVLARSIDTISQARRTVVFSCGLSAAAGLDFTQRLLRLGIACEFCQDTAMMALTAAGLIQGDVAIVISAGGHNRAVLAAAQVAKDSNAVLVGLCPPDSPLAELCVLNLKCGSIERDDPLMTDRIAMQTLLHVVLAGVMLRRADSIRHLKSRLDACAAFGATGEFERQEEERPGEALAPGAPITTLDWSNRR
ncbi:MAG: MurR/RpiR family transcriptional regulator [Succinivibrionaceae bacterium]|nr:MurR/RpiR family transcriptional regulator [Succinivibrionaceae bacterium]